MKHTISNQAKKYEPYYQQARLVHLWVLTMQSEFLANVMTFDKMSYKETISMRFLAPE